MGVAWQQIKEKQAQNISQHIIDILTYLCIFTRGRKAEGLFDVRCVVSWSDAELQVKSISGSGSEVCNHYVTDLDQ